jgi:hypothetical protein
LGRSLDRPVVISFYNDRASNQIIFINTPLRLQTAQLKQTALNTWLKNTELFMKSLITVLALAIVSATSAFAGEFQCKTPTNKFGGGTTIVINQVDAYDAVITGSQNGGEAQFIRNISPVNVKVEHDVDLTTYTNSSEGLLLTVVTTSIGGRLLSSASFREGTEWPTLEMTCENLN